jgi:anti-sigma B factor antagonist
MSGTSQPFSLSVDTADGDATVHVIGEIDMDSSPVLKSRLLELARAGVEKVTVDMTETAFIDSTGLHALVVALKELRVHGGDLVVRSPSKSAARVLQLTGFDTLVEVI